MVATTVAARLGLPVLASILGGALGRIDHPAAKDAAKAIGTVETLMTGGQLSPEQVAEANRHAERMADIEMQKDTASLSQINESLRAEVASTDPYVRRMRPTFGYLMALTWAAQMLALAYVIVFRTSEAHLVLKAVESLSMIWTVGLSVLGIYVYKRSEDKKCGRG